MLVFQFSFVVRRSLSRGTLLINFLIHRSKSSLFNNVYNCWSISICVCFGRIKKKDIELYQKKHIYYWFTRTCYSRMKILQQHLFDRNPFRCFYLFQKLYSYLQIMGPFTILDTPFCMEFDSSLYSSTCSKKWQNKVFSFIPRFIIEIRRCNLKSKCMYDKWTRLTSTFTFLYSLTTTFWTKKKLHLTERVKWIVNRFCWATLWKTFVNPCKQISKVYVDQVLS